MLSESSEITNGKYLAQRLGPVEVLRESRGLEIEPCSPSETLASWQRRGQVLGVGQGVAHLGGGWGQEETKKIPVLVGQRELGRGPTMTQTEEPTQRICQI